MAAQLLLVPVCLSGFFVALVLYLWHINRLLKETPREVGQLRGKPWTPEWLRQTYEALKKSPVGLNGRLPPKLDRRYIVTGGNGLVGGYIVLQLLARGTPPKCIRIVDVREPERDDLRKGLAAQVDFVQTDIASKAAVVQAFSKSWDPTIASLPLTVFHTAAIMIPGARSKHLYKGIEAINVQGTRNVLAASRAVGADIFSSTSSASISVRPVEAFVAPWAEPKHYWQVMDTQDFNRPLREHEDYFANYAFSKAIAERLVCAENEQSFRTGCIRPGNGIYGHPSDNVIGSLLAKEVNQTWIPHIVQNFVHGANVAVAHLYHEAALAKAHCPQAGKPFVVTDEGPPITFGDIYTAVETLSVHSFQNVLVPPIVILLMSHLVEWCIVLPYRFSFLKGLLPEVKGDLRTLQPGLITICTHLVASDAEARKPVHEGGLGYKGLTSLEGVVSVILDWNREHSGENARGEKKVYQGSLRLAEMLDAVGSSIPR
ncbi:cholesterol dehydrogenase [Fusarium beomiforme]|uniref:Cholesterol dehydrogenase n=1 Tax=Fusarium beomiforme TaxID=44412 RepID=A0A9P5DVB5_9HYPO|nr:cholesterol dehydrogenase [Fusarium beomiforme]